jgi:hypothetical protein
VCQGCVHSMGTYNDIQCPPKARGVLSIDGPLALRIHISTIKSLIPSSSISRRQIMSNSIRPIEVPQHTSSSVSNLQLLPSSVTSFHHLSPTNRRPATFFVCAGNNSSQGHRSTVGISECMEIEGPSGSSLFEPCLLLTVQKSSMSRTTTMT